MVNFILPSIEMNVFKFFLPIDERSPSLGESVKPQLAYLNVFVPTWTFLFELHTSAVLQQRSDVQ